LTQRSVTRGEFVIRLDILDVLQWLARVLLIVVAVFVIVGGVLEILSDHSDTSQDQNVLLEVRDLDFDYYSHKQYVLAFNNAWQSYYGYTKVYPSASGE
jgi:hypothetical protein